MSDLIIPSFLRNDVSKSLRSLTKNEQCERITKNERPWVIRSGRSPKISEWANCSFFWAICSFFRRKWAIRSENRWGNYQPWFFFIFSFIKIYEDIPTKTVKNTIFFADFRVTVKILKISISKKNFRILVLYKFGTTWQVSCGIRAGHSRLFYSTDNVTMF